ncbi:hypothetical protein ACG0Z6_02035 [Roseateles sp. BYS180W]|uniref:DUF721 domain-containing protein n=1 Tax=Roseateles rivi TaxID=3299028 RepID=A0ABW7FRR0_9BURK
MAELLQRHDGLARLGALLHASKQRMEIVRPCLPGALTRFVTPGAVDAEGWTLLAANAAIAAKLRHIHPHMELLLREQGMQPWRIRIKLLAG